MISSQNSILLEIQRLGIGRVLSTIFCSPTKLSEMSTVSSAQQMFEICFSPIFTPSSLVKASFKIASEYKLNSAGDGMHPFLYFYLLSYFTFAPFFFKIFINFWYHTQSNAFLQLMKHRYSFLLTSLHFCIITFRAHNASLAPKCRMCSVTR